MNALSIYHYKPTNYCSILRGVTETAYKAIPHSYAVDRATTGKPQSNEPMMMMMMVMMMMMTTIMMMMMMMMTMTHHCSDH